VRLRSRIVPSLGLLMLFMALPGASVAARTTSTSDLQEFTSVLQDFMKAVAAGDGKTAAGFVAEAVLGDYVAWRDLALKASKADLEAYAKGRSPYQVFRLRIHFTREELEAKSGREIYAALVDKKLIGPAAVARILSEASVVSADVVETVRPPRAYVGLNLPGLGQNAGLDLLRDAGGWRIGRGTNAQLDPDFQPPPCVHRLWEKGRMPDKDPDCVERMKQRDVDLQNWIHATWDDSGNMKVSFDDAYGARYFELVQLHAFDPKYWQPLDSTGR
jgi:hypothetical protein